MSAAYPSHWGDFLVTMIRWAARTAAGLAALLVLALAAAGLLDPGRTDLPAVLDGAILLGLALGFWGLVETVVYCHERAQRSRADICERIIAALPPAKMIVARTIEEMEADAERAAAAGLPQIGRAHGI